MGCSITAGSLFDCDDLPQAGVESRLVIGNLDEIIFTIDGSNSSLATAFTQVGAAVAFAFEGSDMSVKPMYNLVPGTLTSQYIHKVEFIIFDVSSTQKKNLELMKEAKLYAIVENNNDSGNGDAFFEIYGNGRGLKLTQLERIPTDTDTLGAFKVTLETFSEGGNESHMPLTFFTTDHATSLTAVTALLT